MANPINSGSIPTTFIWDVQQLQQADVNSIEFKELLIRLYQNLNKMALVLNIKDTGVYDTFEYINGQVYFPNPANNSSTVAAPVRRQVIRKVINFGSLPNAATKSIAHGITCTTGTSFTRIYGTTTKPTAPFSYLPIPYATGVAANIIELYVDGTNVNITTAANYTAYTITYVVLEFIQS